jgi:hypothetical protein
MQISNSDVCQYVQDLANRWRHIDELQKEIKRIADDSPQYQALLEEYATAVGDVCYREECLEQCVRNGEIPASLIRILERTSGRG